MREKQEDFNHFLSKRYSRTRRAFSSSSTKKKYRERRIHMFLVEILGSLMMKLIEIIDEEQEL